MLPRRAKEFGFWQRQPWRRWRQPRHDLSGSFAVEHQERTREGVEAGAVPPRVIDAARWRGRLLERDLLQAHDAPEEQRLLLGRCRELLHAIEMGFSSASPAPEARRIAADTLAERMHATAQAVQRAYDAGVEWEIIERATQRAWPVACDLFDALGWAEAFRHRSSPAAVDASGFAHDLRTLAVYLELHAAKRGRGSSAR